MEQSTEKSKKTYHPKFVRDVVCPICFKPAEYPCIHEPHTDRYGRKLRCYYAWCEKCQIGASVTQFAHDGKWVINAYQQFKGPIGMLKAEGGLVKVNELPDPEAAVVIGPGGDYDHQIVIETVDLVRLAANCLKQITAASNKLLGIIKKKNEESPGH